MRIWVDADTAPRDVRDVVCRVTERLGIGAVFVSGQGLDAPDGYPRVEVVRPLVHESSNGSGPRLENSDDHIVRLAESGDVVVTSDLVVAARLVPRGIASLDARGTEHTAASIEEERAHDDLLTTIRSRGAAGRGPPPYDARAKRDFAAALDRILTRLRQDEGRSASGGISG